MANYTSTGSDTFPAGHILQVQHYINNSESYTTSTTMTATALTDTITTASSSNKVVIIANVAGVLKTGSNSKAAYSIYRGTQNLAAGGSNSVTAYDWMGWFQSGDSGQAGLNINMCYVDSPGSAATHTYTVYYGNTDGHNTYFSVWDQTSQIILMEVKA